MRATIPLTITDDMIVSSTIIEPDEKEPEWADNVTYAEFALVSVISENSHKVFESLVANNINNDPLLTNTDAVPLASAKWKYKYRTNKHRMFDYFKGTGSIAGSPLKLVLRPKRRIDTLAFFDLKASVLDVTVKEFGKDRIIYTLDGFLLERNITSLYEYFFSPFIYRKNVATASIPPVGDPEIHITLSDPSGFVEVGRIAIGKSTYLGKVQHAPVVDADNYSKIVWDEFGKAELTPIPSIPANEHKIILDPIRLNSVRQFRELANAKPVVWYGLDDMEHMYTESMLMFGVYENYQIVISQESYCELNLNIKGI